MRIEITLIIILEVDGGITWDGFAGRVVDQEAGPATENGVVSLKQIIAVIYVQRAGGQY